MIYIAFILFYNLINWYKSVNHQIHPQNDLPDWKLSDCDVAVSKELVGFYCPIQNLLFYHTK